MLLKYELGFAPTSRQVQKLNRLVDEMGTANSLDDRSESDSIPSSTLDFPTCDGIATVRVINSHSHHINPSQMSANFVFFPSPFTYYHAQANNLSTISFLVLNPPYLASLQHSHQVPDSLTHVPSIPSFPGPSLRKAPATAKSRLNFPSKSR